MSEPFTIAVVGSGFSGVMTAVHLLRGPSSRPVRVLMVNRSGVMARGVAYGTSSPSHLLNVPAGKMSALPDDPGHFLRFAQSLDSSITPVSFVRRSIYGAYLEHLLSEATAGRPHGARTARDRGERGRARPRLGHYHDRGWAEDHSGPRGPGGRALSARSSAGFTSEFLDSPYYVRDPWTRGRSSRSIPPHRSC